MAINRVNSLSPAPLATCMLKKKKIGEETRRNMNSGAVAK